MASKERKEREKEDLRRKILAEAQQIINAEGFSALSMRKLANRIEYSAATIYLYFRNREQIARELSEQGHRRLLVSMMDAAANAKDIRKRFKAVASAYVGFGLRDPETYRLIFMGDSEYMSAAFAENSPDSAASLSYKFLIELAEELRRNSHCSRKISARIAADMTWAAMHGIVSLRLGCDGFQSSAEELASVMADTLLAGLK